MRSSEYWASAELVFALAILFGVPLFAILGPNGTGLTDSQFDALFSLGGVLLGAVLALVAQSMASAQQARDRRLAFAYSLFLRVQSIANEAGEMCRHIQADAAECDNDDVLWQSIRPFPWINRTHAAFAPEELSLLMQASDQGYADKLQNLASLKNLLVQLMDLYAEYKARWAEVVEREGAAEVVGEYVSYNSELEAKHQTKIGHLRMLARELRDKATEGQAYIDDVVGTVAIKISVALDDERFQATLGPAVITSKAEAR